MENIHYLATLYYSTGLGNYEMGYQFDTLEELKKMIEEKKEKDSISNVEILEYRLVYEHGNKLPKPDGYNEFFNENTYNEDYKQETVTTIKQKDYKKKVQDYSEIFKIHYKYLERRREFLDTEYPIDYFREVHCVYNAKSKEEGMKMLYDHSRSKSIFDIKFYQCRKVKLN